jgi:hypothetical protein
VSDKQAAWFAVACLVLAILALCSPATAHPPIPHEKGKLDTAALMAAVQEMAAESRAKGGRMPADADLYKLTVAAVLAWSETEIDPAFLLGMAWAESRWKTTAAGDKGKSRGAYQIQIRTARSVYPKATVADLHHPAVSSHIAGLLLLRFAAKYGADRAAVIYNCGPSRCRTKAGKVSKWSRGARGYFRAYKEIKTRAIRWRVLENTKRLGAPDA